jgi:glycosyltransferase involved in cell wall biosynthesis
MRYTNQIIVVDNGSTDKTSDIVQAENVTLIRQERSTIAFTRNCGARASNGEILIFIDADVLISQSWHNEIGGTIESLRQDALIITGSRYDVADKKNWISSYWFARMRHENSNYINGGHLIVTRQLFNKIGGFNSELETAEDYDFCMRAKQFGAKIINDARLNVIHIGYPTTLKDFIARERWLGCEDFMSFKKMVRSKVAIIAIINLLMMVAFFILTVAQKDVLFVLLYFILMSVLSAASTLLKFGFENPLMMSVTSFIFSFYYLGRSMALIDRVKKYFTSSPFCKAE